MNLFKLNQIWIAYHSYFDEDSCADRITLGKIVSILGKYQWLVWTKNSASFKQVYIYMYIHIYDLYIYIWYDFLHWIIK